MKVSFQHWTCIGSSFGQESPDRDDSQLTVADDVPVWIAAHFHDVGAQLFELTSDAAFVERDGVIVAVNAAGCRIYGVHDPAELIGRPTIELVPARVADLLAHRAKRIAETIETDRWAIEEILRRDGSTLQVEVRTTPVNIEDQPAVLILLRPIAAEKRQSDILRSRDRADRVFASISLKLASATEENLDATINSVLEEIGIQAGVDRAYVNQFDGERDELSCTHEWTAPGVEPQIDYVQRLRASSFPWSFDIHASGERIHVPDMSRLPPEAAPEQTSYAQYGVQSMLTVPMMIDGRMRGLVGFNAIRQRAVWPEPVIEQVAAVADALATALLRRDAIVAVREAKEEVEAANQAKNMLLARMSHELRTPLNAVLGFTELLLLDERSDEDHRLLSEVERGGKALRDMIEEVLDLSRIRTGDFPLESEPFDVTAAVRSAMSAVKDEADQAGVRLHLAEGERTTAQRIEIVGDRGRLEQVLTHVMANAIRYNSAGGSVTVSLVRSPINDDEGPYGHEVRLAVVDTGMGMSEEQLIRLFDPTVDLQAATAQDGGVGLGLARLIVEEMGGSLILESAPGVGTTAHITLPA